MRILVISEKPSVAISIYQRCLEQQAKKTDTMKETDIEFLGAWNTLFRWQIRKVKMKSSMNEYRRFTIIPKEYKYEVAKATKKQFAILKN